ncbi:MAG: hypothetical protein GY699_24585 [Desulfobacteraceae bacterium]|nr:hypothetical protein [Desulfobacteraceae bacterium]
MEEITLTLDRNLIHQAERFAVKQSRFNISDALAVQFDSDPYEQAKRRAFAQMDAGYHLGGKTASREALYDR